VFEKSLPTQGAVGVGSAAIVEVDAATLQAVQGGYRAFLEEYRSFLRPGVINSLNPQPLPPGPPDPEALIRQRFAYLGRASFGFFAW
jgi:hypothetical protein